MIEMIEIAAVQVTTKHIVTVVVINHAHIVVVVIISAIIMIWILIIVDTIGIGCIVHVHQITVVAKWMRGTIRIRQDGNHINIFALTIRNDYPSIVNKTRWATRRQMG